jgi:hypothetical protein
METSVLSLIRQLSSFPLYKHQKRMLETILLKPKSYPILSGRRNGITTLFTLFSVAYCLTNSKSNIAIYSPYIRGSNSIRDNINNLLTSNSLENVLKYSDSGRMEFFNESQIILTNGSNINAIRGMKCDYVFIDNFSEYTNQSDLYTTIVPSAQNIIMSSTGTDVGSFFHILYLSAGIKTCQPSILTEETLNKLKETMSDVYFRREFLCEFVDYPKNKEFLLNLRVTEKEKLEIQENSNRLGFRNVSDYLRFKALDRT